MFSTSATLASSISLRLRCLAQSVPDLGPRAVHEAMCLVVGGADPLATFEHLGAFSLHPDPAETYGSGALPSTMRVIK